VQWTNAIIFLFILKFKFIYNICIGITSKNNIYFKNKNLIDCLDNLAMAGPTWVVFFPSGKLADNVLAPKRHVPCTIELARCLFITTSTTSSSGHDLWLIKTCGKKQISKLTSDQQCKHWLGMHFRLKVVECSCDRQCRVVTCRYTIHNIMISVVR